MTAPGGAGGAACARCGTPVPPGARHCSHCGADVSGQQGAYEYDDMETGRGMQRPVSFHATLLREGSSWRLTRLR